MQHECKFQESFGFFFCLSMSNSGIPSSGRSVARPVANLGNTCYMNAVLQALVHAPELCLAMDCEPHHLTCPIAAENAAKLRACSPMSSPDNSNDSNNATATASTTPVSVRKTATRKSRRSGRKTPDETPEDKQGPDLKFCALCEVEDHFRHVHESSNRDSPVAPSAFVNGFIQEVAPWFKLGVQEDSHEFLRLLIDAMQKSCQQARVTEHPSEDNPTTPTTAATANSAAAATNDPQDTAAKEEEEYSFSLFRGMVESNVTCDFCQASSSTLDPIEDVGLEVTVPTPSPSTSGASSQHQSSRNNSPTPTPALSDVQSAFQRFARAEVLDAGYKCENCGHTGHATKQSRLANIPPILTLHLKRFRYGDSRVSQDTSNATVTRRAGRSEVNQLMGNGAADFMTGKSGSAKIEGHIKFEQVVNLRPYLTEELQKQHANMYCRLFSVIVHAGKNSHSGHYIAYVRSLAKNEWWKMDDGRVTHASDEEVMGAEAYMLFYRVVQHPVTLKLQEKYKNKFMQPTEAKKIDLESTKTVVTELSKTEQDPSSVAKRKRPAPEFANGVDWARAKTKIPPHLMGLITKAQEMVAEDIQLSPDFFKYLSDEAAKETAAIGKGPASSICGKLSIWTTGFVKLILNETYSNLDIVSHHTEDDVVGGAEKLRRKLCELFYKLAGHFEGDGGGSFWLSPASGLLENNKDGSEKNRIAVVEAEEDDLL